ncbi:MAG: hypothetical protein UR12_C0052G0002 [candidate division TM6 bacterium GW2011_GWF2_30_66]|jgi:hypothetical protein|nr:MAG: hypothetical protein UR12_C0052G0002 [candidate division TM6 bacterium GW2011_GWF2_30_66]
MKKSFINKKFLKILILVGLTFNVVNLNASLVKSIIDAPKNALFGVVDFVKEIPVELLIVSAAMFAATALVIKVKLDRDKEKALCSKQIMENCLLCGKSNEDCQCNLLQKVNYVFLRYGLHETIRYYNGWYKGRDSNWLEKRIKSVILKINDINMKFVIENNVLSLLHIACLHGHEPIIKWLVEDMFVDVNVFDSNGFSASQMLKFAASNYRKIGTVVGEKLDSFNNIFRAEIDSLLLDKKLELQQKLLDSINSFIVIIERHNKDKKNSIIYSSVKSKFKYITKLIKSKETPGFAKQLVLPDLISIHEVYPEIVSFEDIKYFYKYVAFNYTFLNDERFAKAVEFAKIKEIKDICARTVDQAREVYKEENKGLKFTNYTDFYENSANTTYFYETVTYTYY